ncbi:hypothetical protein WJX74_010842 [Apatococcus lobatus]|uniref:ATP synthase subunit d, mitochondrial n=1 Tax=Apatococcus lobatus TaxID=904363 RepID=A0AAW1S3R4_9CHLO
MAALIRGCKPALQQLRSQLRASSGVAARSFATAEPQAADQGAEEDDPVIAAFHLQQRAYRQIIDGMQNINVPLGGDAAAIQKYADEVEALKKKAGYPDFEELVQAQLAQTMATSSSYSQFLAAATEGKDFGNDQDAVNELIAAAESAEEESGDYLTEDNEQGWSLYNKAVEGIKSKYGLQDAEKMRREAVFGMYEAHLQELKDGVVEATESAKRKDHLEHVEVDLAAIKPKWDRT